jgi:hypothetical protein
MTTEKVLKRAIARTGQPTFAAPASSAGWS